MRDRNGRPRPAAFDAAPGAHIDGVSSWPAAARPADDGDWADQQPGNGRWPGATGWRPPYWSTEPGRGPWPADAQFPLPGWDNTAGFRISNSDSRSALKFAGAPAAADPRLTGRFGAEWSPRGQWLRRNSLLRKRGRARGGAMARKATLDRGLRPDELAADEFAADSVAPDGPLTAGPASMRRSQWGGSGGRWMVWALRAVIWAVVVIVGFRGVASIVASVRQSGTGAAGSTAGAAGSGFPASLAEAFTLQFGQVYLNFSPATAGQRASELTPFIPVGADPQFGWNGAGSQQLQSEQVASISVSNAHQATVTLLARVNTGLIELGVPIYSAQGGLVVSAEPALLPAPDRVGPPPARATASDPAAKTALSVQLPGFFRAYASGDQQGLARFLAPGSAVTGLGGAVTFGAVTAIEVPSGGATRRIAVSVTWELPAPPAPQRPAGRQRQRQSQSSATSGGTATQVSPPPGLQMTYEMTVVKQHGAWYVRAIGPSATQPGGP